MQYWEMSTDATVVRKVRIDDAVLIKMNEASGYVRMGGRRADVGNVAGLKK